MDSLLAVGVGLAIRALIDSIIHDSITASALVGIWEGVVLNHFLAKMPSSFEPYIAFGFRLFVDFLFTESIARMTMIVLWAFLGMVFADIGGDISEDRRFRRLWRRLRREVPFLSTHVSPSRHSSSRVRFLSSSSANSSSSHTSSRTPQLPLRPTATPFPGAFDQWSVASSVIGRDNDSIISESINETTHQLPPPRPSSHLDIATSQTSTHRSPSELEYTALPTIPRPASHTSRITPPASPQSNPSAGKSGLTTPANDTALRDLPDEDRPRIHSGLTTPDLAPPMAISQTREPSPPVPALSVRLETTPARSQLSLPPVPIRPPSSTILAESAGEPVITFPEPQVPPLIGLAPRSSLGLIPSIIGTVGVDSNRNTLTEAPPQYEAPIKDIPDNASDGQSVISETTRSAIIVRADKFREDAQQQEKTKTDYRAALDKARREKRFWDVLWYEGEIESAEQRAKELNAKAAHRYFRAHNMSPEPHTIDVHRLNTVEAVAEVKRALREARSSGSQEVRIIVGQGKHSKNNIPVLRKNIILKMQEYQIDAKPDKTNPGVLIIAIPQSL